MEYQTLYEQYYTCVYRLALLLLKEPHDAEDAAQSVFLKVMEKQPVFSDENHKKAWLLTVTRNHCRDIQRSFWHKKRTAFNELPDQIAEPFDKTDSLLFEIVQSLPAKQREVIYLYYFEDYSIKEIAALLKRKESTVQSQLAAARKRLKKQFSASKAAALSLSLIAALSCCTIAADAASSGNMSELLRSATQYVYESVQHLLSEDTAKLANETITHPIEVYASDLVGASEQFLILANERGLLIYDRERQEIADALDLQEIKCNYLNAETIVTHIFSDDGKLYLFNEQVQGELADGESHAPRLPEFAYCYDLTALALRLQETPAESENTASAGTGRAADFLTRTTDTDELQDIYKRWETHGQFLFADTFDEFQGAEFLDNELAKYEHLAYSNYSLRWKKENGEELLSCLVADSERNYELFTKCADGTIEKETLHLTVAADVSDATTALPAFSYSGDDLILKALCDYLTASDEADGYYHENENAVYIPAPIVYGTAAVPGTSEDIYVFCNLWSYWYYRSGNTLVCESGGEAPARLRLHPQTDGTGTITRYEITEDLRTGDGNQYVIGIQKFCEGFPEMVHRYFSQEEGISPSDTVRTALIRTYVQENDLPIQYYKDYGWDPVAID